MKILQIANKALFPPDGGSLAVLSLSKGYIKNGHQVHLINMVTHKHFNKEGVFEDEFSESLNITGVNINSKVSFFKLLINLLFSKKPYISERFNSKKFKQKLRIKLVNNKYDIVQFEGLYVLQYIHFVRKFFKGKIIYRPHNLEYLIWKRNAREIKSKLKKAYYNITSNRLRKLETKLLNTYDFLIPISEVDSGYYKKFGNKMPVVISPFGIDIEQIQAYLEKNKKNSDQSILYIGALDWIPNQQGLIWFIDNCLPLIVKSHPELILKIAGRNSPNWLINKFKNNYIKYYGEVENAYEFINQNGPVIVPLFSGSGMRVKIIESMALKKAIISTSIAAEGISCKHNENILISDDAKDFSNYVLKALDNITVQREIGEKAFHFVSKNYNFTSIAANIINHIS